MPFRSYRFIFTMALMLVALAPIACRLIGLSAGSKSNQIDDLIEEFVKNRQFNGTALVAEHGKIIHEKAYGFANFELQSPAELETKYRIASVTKQFTSMLVMRLIEQGKLKLDGTVSDYLPEYPKATGSKVTIHHLLTHTSGIPSYTEFPGFMQKRSRDPYQPLEFISFFKDSTLKFEPGAKFAYNNSGYFLLGVIIERVTGKPYGQAVAEEIFMPLGMKNSGYDVQSRVIPKRASGYQMIEEQLVNGQYVDMSIPYASGSLYSTVEDLLLWDKALYTEQLVKRSTLEKIFTPYVFAEGRGIPSYYGYGWFISKEQIGSTSDSVDAIEHGGGIPGFNSLMFRVPKKEQTIILLSNISGTRLRDITRGILGILYDKPYIKSIQSLARVLRADIEKVGLEQAIANYRANKEKKAGFVESENELNALGYLLLQREQKVKEAIAVFKLMVEAYPESWNAYDSLGEGYMVAGDKENAIRNYEKSLELNPKNDNGKNMLKKLGEK